MTSLSNQPAQNTVEDLPYKHDDYDFRSSDPYALTKYRVILAWLPDTNGLQVLNAGCGSGEMNALMSEHNASWKIDAIDVDDEGIQRAQLLKDQLSLQNVAIMKSSIEDFHPTGLYDIIISNDVLEHIDDVEQAIQRLVEMLKPGGLLLVSVPALQWLYGYHDELLGHFRRYNRQLLSKQLAPYFEIKHLRYFGMLLVPIAFYYSRLRHQPYPLNSQRDKTSLAAHIVNGILAIEERIAFPVGTSVLAMAIKRR
ncbi:MAG: methyltransferase domain-containing protein [Anaerolineae bacterium]|nr:methyltransferase domain-containing protein [Anaerolineae bacterium]